MRITTQLLKKVATVPLHEVEYLDLSNEELVAMERLSPCHQLQALVLRNNSIDAVRNIECCRQLWHIDLTGNKVKSLRGLSRFPVLGMLSVAFNDLDWPEVKSLSHIRLVSLTLIGNTRIDTDPHYREHVVDILPHLWVLDGRLITAKERKRVDKFFAKSQSSDHPVRRKALESVFVPTSLKNLMVAGVFGDKSTHLMSRFPINYTHNIDMDKRRSSYLAYTLQQDMELRAKHISSSSPSHTTRSPPHLLRLESLMEQREREVEQCNMLLLLLLAFLEYSLPVNVMKATLETAKLTNIGEVNCVKLLSLPKDMILHCTSLLLNAAAINRQEKKEGGLYDKLYQSLCHTHDRVYRKLLSQQVKRPKQSPRKHSQAEEAKLSQFRCLLASEVVHLMCLMPLFFESLESSPGLMRMVVTATRNPNVADIIGSIAWKVQSRGGDVWEVYHDIASYLMQTTGENVVGKTKRRRTPRKVVAPTSTSSGGGVHRTSSQPLLPSSQPHGQPRVPFTHVSRALSAGAVAKRLRTKETPHKGIQRGSKGLKEPELGDVVLIGEQQIARIVALPEPRVAVLQTANKAPVTNPPGACFYVDTHDLVWDKGLNCWTKDSSGEGRAMAGHGSSASRRSPSPSPEHHSTPALPLYGSTTSLETETEGSVMTLRTATPPGYPQRPLSQISYSDDLQTIPSQEELEIEEESTAVPASGVPVRLDIASLAECQLHDALSSETEVTTNACTKLPQSVPGSEHERQTAENLETLSLCDGGIQVPTPQLHFSDTWESTKSLPSSSTTHSVSKRPHSCHHDEIQRQASRIEPFTSPAAWAVSSSSTHHAYIAPPTAPSHTPSASISTQSLVSTLAHVHMMPSQSAESADPGYRPVVYNAWTTATPSAPSTRHTALTSSRLMTKRHQKTPTTTRKNNSLSRWSSHSQPSSGEVILQQKSPVAKQRTAGSTQHMAAYSSHAQRSVGRYHYQQPRPSTPSKTIRRLGDLGNIYINGISIG